MQRTFSKLLARQCRSPVFYFVADLTSSGIERIQLIDTEFGRRRLHCQLNTNLLAHHNSENESLSETKDSASDMSKWWIDYKKRKNYKDRCLSRISATLECTENVSNFLIDTDPLTFLDKIEDSLRTIDYLIQEGISSENIRKNIVIVRYSDNELKLRIRCMKLWGIDKKYFGDFLPIFKLKTAEFLIISNIFVEEKEKNIPDGNRIIHFAKILDCPVMNVNKAFVRCRGLYRIGFDQIKASLECYLEFGVKPEYILKDISGLRADVETIKLRLSGLFQKKLQPLRPNLVMCTDFRFKKMCKELENKINFFAPYEDAEEYLNATLFSSQNYVSARKRKNIRIFLETLDPKYLINMLKFMSEKNYSADQICVNMQAFSFPVSTLRERYAMLQAVGVKSPSIRAMTTKEDEFLRFVKRTEFNVKEKNDIIAEMGPLVSSTKK